MPRPTQTLDQKLRNARKYCQNIVNKYDGNRDFIIIKAADFRRTKDSNLKEVYNDYQKLIKKEKIITQLILIINDDEEELEVLPPTGHNNNGLNNTSSSSSNILTVAPYQDDLNHI